MYTTVVFYKAKAKWIGLRTHASYFIYNLKTLDMIEILFQFIRYVIFIMPSYFPTRPIFIDFITRNYAAKFPSFQVLLTISLKKVF